MFLPFLLLLLSVSSPQHDEDLRITKVYTSTVAICYPDATEEEAYLERSIYKLHVNHRGDSVESVNIFKNERLMLPLVIIDHRALPLTQQGVRVVIYMCKNNRTGNIVYMRLCYRKEFFLDSISFENGISMVQFFMFYPQQVVG